MDFQTLIKAEAGLIQRMVSGYERRPALAEELVQECLLMLWRAWPSFRGDSSARTFVARVVQNVCVSHVRRAKARIHSTDTLSEDLHDTAPGPHERLEGASMHQRLLSAVQSLPAAQKEVIMLFLEDFGQTEIAEILGITVSNAGVRLARAREALKEKLGGDRHDG
jgi:RNA polymerase sigma-70 factor (ECF subfamily)